MGPMGSQSSPFPCTPLGRSNDEYTNATSLCCPVEHEFYGTAVTECIVAALVIFSIINASISICDTAREVDDVPLHGRT